LINIAREAYWYSLLFLSHDQVEGVASHFPHDLRAEIKREPCEPDDIFGAIFNFCQQALLEIVRTYGEHR
jgi:hypothetical protein